MNRTMCLIAIYGLAVVIGVCVFMFTNFYGHVWLATTLILSPLIPAYGADGKMKERRNRATGWD